MKAPEPILPPVENFNVRVGTLFKNCRMPTDLHHDNMLHKSLSWFLDVAYTSAKTQLEATKPPQEEFPDKPGAPGTDAAWLHVQNLQYLRNRFNLFRRKLGIPGAVLGYENQREFRKTDNAS